MSGSSPLVVVMGVSGSGKSVVGSALARRLGVEWLDGDDLHPAENVAAMKAGRPLSDAQRVPWLEAVGGWLAEHRDPGGVIACSALRRRYRDRLRAHAEGVDFLLLDGDPELIRQRQRSRKGHFMPASLMTSQLASLEPLEPDEHGITLDVSAGVQELVDTYVALRGS